MVLDIMLKCITLLYREHLAKVDEVNSSKELVKNVLANLSVSNKKLFIGEDTGYIETLKNYTLDIANNNIEITKESLLSSLCVILKDTPSVYNSIQELINKDMSESGIKNSILHLKQHVTKQYKSEEIKKLIKTANKDININNNVDNINSYVETLVKSLEVLTVATQLKDPGVVSEIDIGNDNDVTDVMSNVKKHNNGDGRYKTGWKEVNEMLNGGFRLGESVLTSALQHNYKSGFVDSIFAQICMYNKPMLRDKNKKPLNVFVSFEDDMDILLNFLYRYLYHMEHKTLEGIDNKTTQEMAVYVKDKLSATGFAIRLLRVNPNEWSYKQLFNKIIEYEAAGYEIHVVVTDYISKLPNNEKSNKPMGGEVMSLFDNCRQFFSARNILWITPHQLSVDAKQLLRNNIPPKEFVKAIANKGYYEGSKQIDQIVDLEIHQHIVKIGKQYYLTFQRGKRRYPEIVDDEKKYFMLPFPPNGGPIPPNLTLEGEYIGFYYENDANINSNQALDDNFDF